MILNIRTVIPAKAGIFMQSEIPAFAGMTDVGVGA
jgi:hypothetical protein